MPVSLVIEESQLWLPPKKQVLRRLPSFRPIISYLTTTEHKLCIESGETMNAPVAEIQEHLSCKRVGSGRYCYDDDTRRLNIKLTRESALVEKLDIVKINNELKRSKSDNTKRSSSTTDETKSCCSSVPTKNVRFALDKKGRVLCESHKNRERRTKMEIGLCWYTQAEFKEFRRNCKQEAINQQKTTYRENFAAVYAACTKGSFKGVTKERAYISAASCRGLEVIVFPTLYSDRKNAVASVLKAQAALPDTMSAPAKEDAIASASRFLSKHARQLARVLGSGDAAVVVANNRIAAMQNAKGIVPHVFINC